MRASDFVTVLSHAVKVRGAEKGEEVAGRTFWLGENEGVDAVMLFLKILHLLE